MATQGSHIPDPLLSSEGTTPFAPATPVERSTIAEVGTPHTIGNYQLLEEVAHGGMGVVFKAQHLTGGAIIALKTIRLDRTVSEQMAQRFEREIQAVRQLKHPNVVPIHDVGHDGLRPYFTMDFAQGGNLGGQRRRFQANRRAAIALMVQVARGVHHAHEQGILHRDLKPANILLDAQDAPLVSDFGLARFLDEETELTRTGEAVGTPGYMAPEQAIGQRQRISPRTDIWSLGVILYELLVGRKPFLSEDRAELAEQIQNQQQPSLRSLKPDVDPAVEAIVAKCLEKDPADRYTSALALASDLEDWLTGHPIRVRKASWIRRLKRGLRRHPRLVMASLLAITAMMFVAVCSQIITYYGAVAEGPNNSDLGLDAQQKPPGPDEPLRVLERKLAAGQLVDLIAETGRPVWHQVKSGGFDHREPFKLDSNGLFTIDASDSICLVELMPDPQLKRYRFRASVRQNSTVEDGLVGLYANYFQVVDEEIRHHFYSALAFTESMIGLPRGKRELLKLKFDHHHDGPEGQDGFNQLELRRTNLPCGTWRELRVDITPDHIATFLNDVEFKQVDRATMNKFNIDSRRKWLPDLELPRFRPRQGIGLYVYLGSASFKSVFVEPIP